MYLLSAPERPGWRPRRSSRSPVALYWSSKPVCPRRLQLCASGGGVPLQAELACPVANTLFFAGEATEQAGHQATVHGALYAGQRAADEVLRTLSS